MLKCCLRPPAPTRCGAAALVEGGVAARRKLAAARPEPARAVLAKNSRRVELMMLIGNARCSWRTEWPRATRGFCFKHEKPLAVRWRALREKKKAMPC